MWLQLNRINQINFLKENEPKLFIEHILTRISKQNIYWTYAWRTGFFIIDDDKPLQKNSSASH